MKNQFEMLDSLIGSTVRKLDTGNISSETGLVSSRYVECSSARSQKNIGSKRKSSFTSANCCPYKRHRNIFSTFSLCSSAPSRTLVMLILNCLWMTILIPVVRGEGGGAALTPGSHVTNNGGYVEIPCCSHQFRRKGIISYFTTLILLMFTYYL